MMIKLSPVRADESLTAYVDGDALSVNGELIDFSLLPDGGYIPPDAISSKWIIGGVFRREGDIHLTLALPHGACAPRETRFPVAYDVPMMVDYGSVPLPPYDSPPAAKDEQPLGYEQEVGQ
ncbi:hypothetical protein P5G63_19695 [Aeromonas salmonicida]|uniref:hypothetical protein n=1 Tax=Aeromonas salmonicida TaxID=645 RepID=UPI0022408460|nr:hypothetical protein [Aeromonas salmonicida]MDF8330588.1 hypothetical protein [Aeromonas salmonicida]